MDLGGVGRRPSAVSRAEPEGTRRLSEKENFWCPALTCHSCNTGSSQFHVPLQLVASALYPGSSCCTSRTKQHHEPSPRVLPCTGTPAAPSSPHLTASGPAPHTAASPRLSLSPGVDPITIAPVPAPNISGRHLPCPTLPLPPTRHTRDLAFAGHHQMRMHSNAIKMKIKHTRLTHAKPVRKIANAHSVCSATRAPITTRSPTVVAWRALHLPVSPTRRRWVAPFYGLPPSA